LAETRPSGVVVGLSDDKRAISYPFNPSLNFQYIMESCRICFIPSMRELRSWLGGISMLCLIAALSACGGGGGSDGPVELQQPSEETVGQTAVLSGRVTTAADGKAVQDATVKAGGQTATTNADGRYSFEFEDPKTSSTVVVVEKQGFLMMAKEAPLAAGQTNTRDVKLQAVDVEELTFASTGGVTAALPGGAEISIPPNAIKDPATGAAYTGPVKLVASYRNPTTEDGVDAFPQPYAGIATGGESVSLQTVGVIEATLSAPDGKPLQLGSPATLVYPGVDSVGKDDEIPLWWYDTGRGIWVEEGVATRSEDQDGRSYYSGQVSHFTAWNLDVKWGGSYTGTTINYCVNFAGGEDGRYGIQITLNGPGYSTSVYVNPLFKGNHSLINVPANTALTLSFHDEADDSTQSLPIPATAPGGTATVPCVTLKGTATYVPPPPPPPPEPADPDAPVSDFTGPLVLDTNVFWGSSDPSGERGYFFPNLVVEDSGNITGSIDLFSFDTGDTVEIPATGQMTTGGNFTFNFTRPDGNGPIVFTGRVYDTTGWRSIYGTWSYTRPGVVTPSDATFCSGNYQGGCSGMIRDEVPALVQVPQ
jgi:hypothetical protein